MNGSACFFYYNLTIPEYIIRELISSHNYFKIKERKRLKSNSKSMQMIRIHFNIHTHKYIMINNYLK
jgi:hypothetical protein